MPIDPELEDPNADEDLSPQETRRHRRLLDSLTQRDDELLDLEDDGDCGKRNHRRIVLESARRMARVRVENGNSEGVRRSAEWGSAAAGL